MEIKKSCFSSGKLPVIMPRILKSLMNNAVWLVGWLGRKSGFFREDNVFLLGRPCCYTHSVSRKLLALKKTVGFKCHAFDFCWQISVSWPALLVQLFCAIEGAMLHVQHAVLVQQQQYSRWRKRHEITPKMHLFSPTNLFRKNSKRGNATTTSHYKYPY